MLLVAPIGYAQQPTIDTAGAVNAASYTPLGLPGSGVAQGAMFIAKGQNLGPATLVKADALPLGTTLAGTSIQVRVNGATVSALLYYAWTSQVAAILPSSTPVGTGTFTVTYNGQTSAPAPIQVVANRFGIYTINSAGTGPAIVQNVNSATDLALNTLTTAAKPGQTVVIWGTGLGPIGGDDSTTPPAGNLNVPVTVLVGGKPATVLYQGRSGFPATDQINAQLPADVLTGCYVPIAVTASGVLGNFGSIAISSDGGPCSDPITGISSADLANLASKGSVSVAAVMLNRGHAFMTLPLLGNTQVSQDSVAGSFMKFTSSQMVASEGAIGGLVAPGTCWVYTFAGSTSTLADPVKPAMLDAGPQLDISGLGGARQVPEKTAGDYSGVVSGGGLGQANFYAPGVYNVDNGVGGADVGAFKAQLTIPTPVTFAPVPSNISRSKDLTVTWTGGTAGEVVEVSGSSVGAANNGATFLCTEQADKNTFTVPAAILGALPAGNGGTLILGSGLSGAGNRFTAPGLDIGVLTYTEGTQLNVNWQ